MKSLSLPPRALTAIAAAAYLGISRREFQVNWSPGLSIVIAGNRKLFDKAELDALFEQKKERHSTALQSLKACPQSSTRKLQRILSACGQLSRRRKEVLTTSRHDFEGSQS